MAWTSPKTSWAAADGVAASDMNRIEGNILALKPVVVSVTLPTSGWAGTAVPYTQTVNVSGVTATGTVVYSVASNATSAQFVAAADAQINATSQGAGTMSFSAFSEKPTVDIPLTVMILA